MICQSLMVQTNDAERCALDGWSGRGLKGGDGHLTSMGLFVRNCRVCKLDCLQEGGVM